MGEEVKKFLKTISYLLFPRGITCNRCGCELTEKDDRKKGFCRHCIAQFKPLTEKEQRYGEVDVFSLFEYEGIVRDMIIDGKDDAKPYFMESIGVFLYEYSESVQMQYDLIAYVPASKRNRRRRGYDHIRLVAETFSEKSKKPLFHALERVGKVKDQTKVSYEQRESNIKGTFCVQGNVADKKILLLDDVVTGGSTIGECAAVLKQAGAKEVFALTFSRSGKKPVR